MRRARNTLIGTQTTKSHVQPEPEIPRIDKNDDGQGFAARITTDKLLRESPSSDLMNDANEMVWTCSKFEKGSREGKREKNNERKRSRAVDNNNQLLFTSFM